MVKVAIYYFSRCLPLLNLFSVARMVKDFVARNKSQELRQLIKVLGQDFAASQNPNTRKGGLIGLAATAIALGKVMVFSK